MSLRNLLLRSAHWGIDPLLKRLIFLYDYCIFTNMLRSGLDRLHLSWQDRHMCLNDKTKTTGFDSHYIYHTAWAARTVASISPVRHVDIGSSLYFCAMLSAFVPVSYYDYRPASLHLDNLTSAHADLLHLPFADASIPSLSCMHTVEHVGLGRYGDTLDPDGDLKAMAELQRVLAAGGSLLFVVPVGRPRVVFNAHRIYSYADVMQGFQELELRQFSLISDEPCTGLIDQADPAIANAQSYGCGCFRFERPSREL
jgi:hypothetical protein